MDLQMIARALGGEVCGRQVRAPGPGHTRQDRSLSIRFDPCAPDGFLTYSFSGDDWRTCRDHVRDHLRLPAWNKGRREAAVDLAAISSARGKDAAEGTAKALAIWREARDPRGSPI